jgi:hypothetical protein
VQDVTKFKEEMDEYCKTHTDSKNAQTRDETQKKIIMEYIQKDIPGGFEEVDRICGKAIRNIVLPKLLVSHSVLLA